MADSNQFRRAEFDFADNDPFAELTRIMGHDPRAAARPAQPVVADLDAGKEPAQDFGEFDEPAGKDEQAPHWQAASEADLEADYEQVAAHAVPEPALRPVEDVSFADAASEEPAYMPEPVESQEFDEDFAEAFEMEMQAGAEAAPQAPIAEAPAWTHAEVEAAGEPAAFEDEGSTPVEATFYRDEPEAFEVPETGDEDSAPVEAAFYRDEPEAFEDEDSAPVEAAFYQDEPEAVVQPQEPVWAEPLQDEPVAAEPQAWEPVAVPQPAPASTLSDEISLEDELNALLAAAAPVPAPAVVAAPLAAAVAAPRPVAEAWRPSAHTFGRANLAAPRWQTAAPVQAAAVPASAAAADPFEALATIVAPPVDAPQQAPAMQPEVDDIASMLGELELEIDDMAGDEPAAVQDATAFAAPEALDEPAELDREEPVRYEEPVAYEEPATYGEPASYDEPLFVEPEAAPEPAVAEFGHAEPADQAEDDTPAIDTVEVAEGAVPVTDDLEIPDIDYGTPAPPLYDDLENEFEHAFRDLPLEEPAQPAPVPAAAPFEWNAAAAEPFYGQQPAEAAAHGEDQDAGAQEWQPQPHYAQDFDYETDLQQAIAMSAYEEDEPEEQAPRRRGLIVAAFVAAVAVVGGAGVFGMSLFGSGSDSPALVLADADPMKVRPVNPGGTTVPNQNSEVYQRVGGGASQPAAPVQERLITTAEEPLDIAAEEPAELPPAITGEGEGEQFADDDLFTAETATGATQPLKSEERIEQVEEASGGLPGDVAVVTPRRVRTMVVRPDGSMVAREDPLPQPLEEPAETVIAAAPLAAAPALAPANPVGRAAVDADEGPLVEVPEEVAVLPAPRAELPEPAVAVERPAPTPVLAPATAAAAAPGAWSMQIASQPSAEGAQSTYQDLARRYGNVLQGRGVNIVRANIAGKGVYYRVRIPAQSREEAIQLCTRYKSAGGSCFVSR